VGGIGEEQAHAAKNAAVAGRAAGGSGGLSAFRQAQVPLQTSGRPAS